MMQTTVPNDAELVLDYLLGREAILVVVIVLDTGCQTAAV